jgi:hypothetical protein
MMGGGVAIGRDVDIRGGKRVVMRKKERKKIKKIKKKEKKMREEEK